MTTFSTVSAKNVPHTSAARTSANGPSVVSNLGGGVVMLILPWLDLGQQDRSTDQTEALHGKGHNATEGAQGRRVTPVTEGGSRGKRSREKTEAGSQGMEDSCRTSSVVGDEGGARHRQDREKRCSRIPPNS